MQNRKADKVLVSKHLADKLHPSDATLAIIIITIIIIVVVVVVVVVIAIVVVIVSAVALMVVPCFGERQISVGFLL